MSSTVQIATSSRRQKEAADNLRLPMRGVIRRPLPDLDSVQVEMAMVPGSSRLRALHPYIGPNSWLRVMPEKGTMVLTSRRGDDYQEEIIGYHVPQPHIRIKQYKQGLVLYRPLDEGEIEIMSAGRAYAFFGSRGDIELRGGAIRQDLSQTNLEINSIAPTYNRRLHKASPSTLGYEERFGVVKRPDILKPNLIQNYVRQPDLKFSLEYSRWLSTTDGLPLVDLQEGHVVDGTGLFVKQSSTGKTLRSRRQWHHKAAGNITFEIDEEMNVFFSNVTPANETKVLLGAKNVLTLTGQDLKLTMTKTGTLTFANSYALRTATANIDATSAFTVKTPKAHINSVDVGFGPAPVLSLALATPSAGAITTTAAVMQGFVNSIGTVLGGPFPAILPAVATANAALAQVQVTASQIPIPK